MALLKLSFDGTFNDSLPGTHVDAGDTYSFEGILDTSATDTLGVSTEVGLYPGAFQSYNLVVDGVTFTQFSNPSVLVGNSNTAEQFTVAASDIDDQGTGVLAFGFDASNQNNFFLDNDSLEPAINSIPNYETEQFSLSNGSTTAFATVENQNISNVPEPGSGGLVICTLAVAALSRKVGRALRSTPSQKVSAPKMMDGLTI